VFEHKLIFSPMIETILNALIQLFALISDVHDISEISSREKDIVRLFLSQSTE
jgi:hypothetical protein